MYVSRSRQAPPSFSPDSQFHHSFSNQYHGGFDYFQNRGVASEVLLTPGEDGMYADCAVNAYNIQTIPKAELGDFITSLSRERMREVRKAIEFAFGFDRLT